MIRNAVFRRSRTVIFCTVFSSCTQLTLDLPSKLPILATMRSCRPEQAGCLTGKPAEVPIAWSKGHLASSHTLGFQFLGPLPMGRIVAISPELHLLRALENKLMQENLRPITVKSKGVPVIELEDLRLNAYDFLFTRKVSCTARVNVSTGRQTRSLESQHSEYHKYAFEPELDFVLRHCLRGLASEIRSLL